jgi:hypothetical protein
MNNFVAKIFGALLSGLHLTVLLFLALFIYFAWEAGSISSLEETSSNIFGGGIFITLVFFILYVIFIGLGSCQQRWPFFHAARFKLIDSLMCSFGGLSQT